MTGRRPYHVILGLKSSKYVQLVMGWDEGSILIGTGSLPRFTDGHPGLMELEEEPRKEEVHGHGSEGAGLIGRQCGSFPFN